MSEVKAGESIKVAVEGNDANGQTLNRVTFEVFGLTRVDANAGSASIVEGLVATVASWPAPENA